MGGEVKRSALSCLTSSSPRRGGAGSARPQRGHGLDRGMFPLGHRLIVNHPVGMGCPGLRPARIRGRGDRAPPRKSLFASFPALCRQAVFSGRPPAEGRALHARKEGIGLTEGCAREAAGLWPHHRVEMKCLGIRTAVPCGRGDRVLPRQRPPRYPRPSTARRPVSACPPPGGAGSARPQGRLCPYREIAPSGQRPLACPSMIMTCPGLRRIRISGPAERVPVREEKLERCEARVATLGKEKSIFWSRREEVSRNSPPPWVEKCWSSGAVWRLRMEKFPFSPSGSMRRQGRSRS